MSKVTPSEKNQPSISPANSQTADVLEFWVDGVPRPQGSKRHVGGGRMVEASPHLKAWRDTISARTMVEGPDRPLEGPVGITIQFLFLRPKSHYRTGKNAHLLRAGAPDRPTTRSVGDIDKLARAVLDGISVTSGGQLLQDDSSVVWVFAEKDWAEGDEGPGAYVRVVNIG